MNKFFILLLVVVLIVGGYAWSFYNGLAKQSQAIDGQWAQVENQFQRRFDLLPNLVASVKGAMSQEQKVFGDLADARWLNNSTRDYNSGVTEWRGKFIEPRFGFSAKPYFEAAAGAENAPTVNF